MGRKSSEKLKGRLTAKQKSFFGSLSKLTWHVFKIEEDSSYVDHRTHKQQVPSPQYHRRSILGESHVFFPKSISFDSAAISKQAWSQEVALSSHVKSFSQSTYWKYPKNIIKYPKIFNRGGLIVTCLIQKSTVSEIERVQTYRRCQLTHLCHPQTASYGGIHPEQWILCNWAARSDEIGMDWSPVRLLCHLDSETYERK